MIGRRTLAAALSALVLVLSVALAEAADKKVIRLWQTETEPQTLAVLNQMAAEYEKTHPDVSVKIEGLAWGDLERKLTAALAAGAPPDAAHGQPITCVSFAAKGLLRPVDDLADSIPKDNLVDAFRNLCQWNGKTYGVGHSPASSVFVYRKDLLAQKGLKVPRTWDELVQVAEALKEVRDGQVVRWGLTMTGQPLFINIAVGELLRTHGGPRPDAGGAARLRAVDGLQGCQGRPRGGGLPQVLLPGRELRPVPAFGADPPPVDQEVHLSEPEIRGQRDDPEVAALGGHAGEVLPERLDQAGPGHGLGGHEEALPARGHGVGHSRGHGARLGEGRAVRRGGRPGAETRRGAARELWLPEEVALRRRLPGAVLGVLWILPALVLITSLILYPVAYAIWLSLFDKHSFFPAERWVGLGNYARIAGDGEFWDSLWKGVVYAGASTGLQLVLGLAAALVLHQAFRGRTAIRALVLFPYMIPTIVAVIVWRWLLNETYGVVDDVLLRLRLVREPVVWLGVDHMMASLIAVSVWQFTPFVVVSLLARLQTIPPQLREAARVDGASAWARFRHVTLPQLRAVLFVVVLLRSIWMFTKFDTVWLWGEGAGAGREIRTLPIYAYMRTFTYYQAGFGAALAVIMFLMLMAATLVYFRLFWGEEEAA